MVLYTGKKRKIRTLTDVGKYKGLDGKWYGSYKKGQIVILPDHEYEWFIKARLGEFVKSKPTHNKPVKVSSHKRKGRKIRAFRRRRPRLVGKSDLARDKQRKAKHSGVRTSKSGNKYSETRRNRADTDRRKRL